MKSFFGRRCSSEGVDDGLPRWVGGFELKTCTGASGICSTSDHASVAIAPEITIQAKTVSAGAGDATHAMLANSSLRDRNANTSSTVQANSNGAQLMVAQ